MDSFTIQVTTIHHSEIAYRPAGTLHAHGSLGVISHAAPSPIPFPYHLQLILLSLPAPPLPPYLPLEQGPGI